MSDAFDGYERFIDEDGRLWVSIFGRMTPMTDPGAGSAGVPARPKDAPPPLAGRGEAEYPDPCDADSIDPDHQSRS